MKKRLLEISMVALGTLIMMVGFYFFLLPNRLVIGGYMGIIVLLEPLYEGTFITAWMLQLVLNSISITIGGLLLGKQFFKRTVFSALLGPLFLFILEFFPVDALTSLMGAYGELTPLILGGVFGGLLVGIGVGMVVRNNATTGGVDVIQRVINKYGKMPISVAIFITDGAIILAAIILGITQGDITLGMIGIVSIFIAAVTIERVAVFGRTSYTTLIVTTQPEELKTAIYDGINRGITRIQVMGGYSGEDKEMLICTTYRQQLYDLKYIVKATDPASFMLVLHTKQVMGMGFVEDDFT